MAAIYRASPARSKLKARGKPGEIRIYAADPTSDQPAPADAFSAPRKTAAALLLFDPQVGVFQRVNVVGQIVHARGTEYFMIDGTNGLRFMVKKTAGLRAGDLGRVGHGPRSWPLPGM